MITWIPSSKKSDFPEAFVLRQCGAPSATGRLSRLRRTSRFELLYLRFVVLALSLQPNSSRWRSAGQSTGRKTALIEMVSPTRLYPRVLTLRGRTVIRTILSHDDTSAPVETTPEREA